MCNAIGPKKGRMQGIKKGILSYRFKEVSTSKLESPALRVRNLKKMVARLLKDRLLISDLLTYLRFKPQTLEPERISQACSS